MPFVDTWNTWCWCALEVCWRGDVVSGCQAVSVLWGCREQVWRRGHGGTGAGVRQAGVADIAERGEYVCFVRSLWSWFILEACVVVCAVKLHGQGVVLCVVTLSVWCGCRQ